LPAATLAVAGLTYASRPVSDERRGLVAASACIALAALIYQGTFLAFCLLPLVLPWKGLVRPSALATALSIACLTPVLMLTALVVSGDRPGQAFVRIARGEANEKARDIYVGKSAWPYIAAVTLGPAQSFAPIPDNRGLRGSWQLLRSPETAAKGIFGLAGALLGGLLLIAILHGALKDQRGEILLGLAGILALPLARSAQYSYLKFYVLIPFFVGVTAPVVLRWRIMPWVGLCLLALNIGNSLTGFQRDRVLNAEVKSVLFDRVKPDACYATMGWGVPYQDWPGMAVAGARFLNAGGKDGIKALIENETDLLKHLESCYCKASAVYTDSFLTPLRETLVQDTQHFAALRLPVEELLLEPQTKDSWKFGQIEIQQYSPEHQRQACAALRSALTK